MIPMKSTKSGGKSVRAEATPQPTNHAEISITSPEQQTKKENERNDTKATSSKDVNMTSAKSPGREERLRKKTPNGRFLSLQ